MQVLRGALIALVVLLTACVIGMFVFRKVILPQIQTEQAAGLELSWNVLLPEEAFAAYEVLQEFPENEEARVAAETSTVAQLDGQRMAISGFMVPLDALRDTTHHFLLVPYQGACIHTPAPPPNQVISIYAEDGAKLYHNWQPVTATGIMSVANDSTDLAEAGYVMTLDRLAPFKDRSDGSGTTFEKAEGAHESPLL
jgi:hypothetical protein